MDEKTKEQIVEFRNLMKEIRNITAKFQPLKRLSLGESALLNVILHNEKENVPTTSSELSEKLHVSKPAISRMLNSVEEKGLIQRVTEKNDRRMVFVHSTEEGRKVFEDELKNYRMVSGRIILQMGQEDMDTFLRVGNKLCRIMNQEMEYILESEK